MKYSSEDRLRRRRRAEQRFRWYGRGALIFAGVALCTLLVSIALRGVSGFFSTTATLEVPVPLSEAYLAAVRAGEPPECEVAFRAFLKDSFPEASSREGRRAVASLFSIAAPDAYCAALAHSASHVAIPVASWVDQFVKGRLSADALKNLSDDQSLERALLERLRSENRLVTQFDPGFFLRGDSRQPELAGVGGAAVGSLYTLVICFLLSFPIGVGAAVYLEEFAPRSRWTDLIEININNLAAVPSIIFGLLGLAVILNGFGVPRGTPIAGGIVLALLTLPTIIIACRSALRAVPPSLRQGALAMGASPTQVVLHHVLPSALPGTITGAIIGLARALGETAPLLMIGMVAFIADIPPTPAHPSAALPVQVYLWAEIAERGFVEKTSAGILVILVFLGVMNGVAVALRRRYEIRWQ